MRIFVVCGVLPWAASDSVPAAGKPVLMLLVDQPPETPVVTLELGVDGFRWSTSGEDRGHWLTSDFY